MMVVGRNRDVIVCAVALLCGCGEAGAKAPATQSGEGSLQPSAVQAPATVDQRTEAALLDQLSCKRPPQAGVAFSAMLRNHLIAVTNDGGDGVVLFVPVKPMSLMGFDVIRMAGWQPNADGGAAPPFSRGPGTSPPNFISITVRATESELQSAMSRSGLVEGRYVPDLTQNAWVDNQGNIIQPQRKVPGPMVQAGDNDLASNPVAVATTIECSANEYDFNQELEAQFGG